jgi:hypothetical protein
MSRSWLVQPARGTGLASTFGGIGLESRSLPQALYCCSPSQSPRQLNCSGSKPSAIGLRGNATGPLANETGQEIDRRVLGPENVQSLTPMGNLAIVVYDERRYAEAETLFRETLAIGSAPRERRD